MAQGDQDRMIVVAQFAGPHGVRGDYKIRSFTEDPEAVFGYGLLRAEDGEALTPKKVRALKPGLFLCRSREVTRREDCARFSGALLHVPRAALPPAEDEDIYIADLIGMLVVDEGGAPIGHVENVANHGAGDILEVKGEGGLVLVPFTKDQVPEISLAEGRLVALLMDEDDEPGAEGRG